MSGTRLPDGRSAVEGRRSPVSDLVRASSQTLMLVLPRGFPLLVLALKINNVITSHMWSLN